MAFFNEGRETVAEFVARIRAEAGLAPKCGDPDVLGRMARDLAGGLKGQLSGETAPRSGAVNAPENGVQDP